MAPILSFSQEFSNVHAEDFIEHLIYNINDLDKFIDSSEMDISNRLNILIENVPKKYMISYDIDENIKTRIRNNELKYDISTQLIDDSTSKVIFKVSQRNYQKEFYFKNKKLI